MVPVRLRQKLASCGFGVIGVEERLTQAAGLLIQQPGGLYLEVFGDIK